MGKENKNLIVNSFKNITPAEVKIEAITRNHTFPLGLK